MKNLLAIVLLMLFSLGLSAQEEVKKEKLSIKIVKEEDGKRELIEKTFNSHEEMKAWLKENGHDAKGMRGNHHRSRAYQFNFDDENGEHDKEIRKEIEIRINGDLSEEELERRFKECEGKEMFFKHEFSEDMIKEMKEHGTKMRLEMRENHLDEVMEKVESELKTLRESLEALDEETMNRTLEIVRGALEETKLAHPHPPASFFRGHPGFNKRCDTAMVFDTGNGNHFFSEVVIVKCHIDLEELDEEDKAVLNESGLNVFKEELSLQDLSVYPNPNDGNFNVRFELAERGKTSVRVMNNKGEIVLEKNLGKTEGLNQESVELSDQPAGIYYLQIIQGKNATTRKVVVN